MKAPGAVALAVALASIHAPVAARRDCPAAQVDEVAALIVAANGDAALLVARVRRRLETEDVRCWAKTGDKDMMLELARRFEEGDGVARDVVRAEALYVHAGTSSGGPIWIWVPGFNGQRGQVMQVGTGIPVSPGLPEATYRRALLHLERRAAKPSLRRGMKLLERLAKAGYAPAVSRLAAIPRA